MKKLYAKTLAIEITRRCNMTCEHCLRGDAENVDISHKDIRNLLKHFKSIHHFIITGGEPSLNVKAIRYILKQVKHFEIDVHDFYLATNGSKSTMSDEFIEACKDLFEYQEEKDQEGGVHMLDMSDDRFHDKTTFDEVYKKLSPYKFFGLRGQKENIYLIKDGRSNKGVEIQIFPIYLTTTDYVYGDIYLNAEGMILSNGNLSYESQRKNSLCHSGRFWSYMQTTLRK